MTNSFKIVVRSYGRAAHIAKHTVGFLNRQEGLDTSSNLFLVVHRDQVKEYEEALKECSVAGFIVKDKKGGHESIKAAHRFFPEGEPLLFMDDDFIEIFHYEKLENRGRRPLRSIVNYADDAFRTCAENGIGLWGVNLTNNFLYKKNSPFKEIKPAHICGGFFGGFNESILCTEQAHEEDRIRGARYIVRDGGTLIYNWLGAPAPLLEGGMAQDRSGGTRELCEEAFRTEPAYAKICSDPFLHKSEGYWTVRFKNRTQLRKIIRLKEVRWSGFFQEDPDPVRAVPGPDLLEMFSEEK